MGSQPFHRGVHEIGDDVLRMVEFDRREEAGIAGDVGNREICRFSLRKHGDLQRNRFPPIVPMHSLSYRAACGRGPEKPAASRTGKALSKQMILTVGGRQMAGRTAFLTGKQFYARQLRDAKIKPLVETFDDEPLDLYAKACG
jgi:hypothetical protein